MRKRDFHIDGTAAEVVHEIFRLFNQEKERSRSKAIDNLQSRIASNATVLIEAGYLNFRELMAQLADLEKSISDRKGSDAPTMDKIEAFMQSLEEGSMKESEPLSARHEPEMGDFDLEDEVESVTEGTNGNPADL